MFVSKKMDNIRSQNDNDDIVEIEEKDNKWPHANEKIFIELMIE